MLALVSPRRHAKSIALLLAQGVFRLTLKTHAGESRIAAALLPFGC